MDHAIDRFAKWLANMGSDDSGGPESRRRFLRRGAKLTTGIVGWAALGGALAPGARARKKRNKKKDHDDHVRHIGPGPEEPIYWPREEEEPVYGPPEGGVTIQNHVGYGPCYSGEYCGACSHTSYVCAGRYNGPK